MKKILAITTPWLVSLAVILGLWWFLEPSYYLIFSKNEARSFTFFFYITPLYLGASYLIISFLYFYRYYLAACWLAAIASAFSGYRWINRASYFFPDGLGFNFSFDSKKSILINILQAQHFFIFLFSFFLFLSIYFKARQLPRTAQSLRE